MQGLPGNLNDYDDSIRTSDTVGEFCMKMQIRGVPFGIPDCAEFLAERAMNTTSAPDENEKEVISQIFKIILGSKTKEDKILQGLGTKRMFSTIMIAALQALSSVMGPNEDVTYGDDMRITVFSLITLIVHRLNPGFIENLRDEEGNNPPMCIIRSTKLDVMMSLLNRTGFADKHVDSIVEKDRPMMEAIFALLSVGCDPNAKNNNGDNLFKFLSTELVNEENIKSEKRRLLDKARKFGIILEEKNLEEEC